MAGGGGAGDGPNSFLWSCMTRSCSPPAGVQGPAEVKGHAPPVTGSSTPPAHRDSAQELGTPPAAPLWEPFTSLPPLPGAPGCLWGTWRGPSLSPELLSPHPRTLPLTPNPREPRVPEACDKE